MEKRIQNRDIADFYCRLVDKIYDEIFIKYNFDKTQAQKSLEIRLFSKKSYNNC